MFSLRLVLTLGSWLCVSAAYGQIPDDGKKSEDPPVEQTEVRFTDDSIVRMCILQERLDISTKYGKLVIPTADIVKIEFGVHISPELQKSIAKAIDELGHENYKTRELAVKDLVNWGPSAYPQLYRAAKSNQLEVQKRALVALDKLKAKHPARNLRLREEDVIVTSSFTIVGNITNPTVKAKAENFGELDLQLSKLRGIRWLSSAQEITVAVDAGKYANGSQWMDSGFEVQQGMSLHVVASGSVDLWPQNGGGFISGPAGLNNGQFAPNRGGKGQQFLPGTLLGRIGETGTPFMIGDQYTGTPDRDGKLFLQIVPSPWIQQGASQGAYTVKISPRGEFGGD